MLTQIFRNCPSEVILEGVRVERTQAAVEDLVATWTLLDDAGEELGTGTAEKIDDTEADYLVFVPMPVAALMTVGCEYILRITDEANLGIDCPIIATNYVGRAS